MPPNILDKIFAHLMGASATLPQRAIQNSQQSLDSGNYDPGPTLEAATLPMGTGAIAGVPVRAGEAVLGAGPIRAFHGSPHDFNAFSLDKIGTGEGNQAYGHGLYFGENPETAKAYQTTLGRDPEAFNVAGKIVEKPSPEFAAASLVHRFQEPPSAIAARLPDAPAYLDIKEVLKQWSDKTPDITPGRGRMYEVNINADPEHFLDWDKPPSQQPENVRAAIDKVMSPIAPSGYSAHPDLGERSMSSVMYDMSHKSLTGSHANASQALRDAGVPGIKYLDQGSRASGDGSRNYVVFNDKLIDVLRKYGIAGLPAAGVAGAAASQQASPPPFGALSP